MNKKELTIIVSQDLNHKKTYYSKAPVWELKIGDTIYVKKKTKGIPTIVSEIIETSVVSDYKVFNEIISIYNNTQQDALVYIDSLKERVLCRTRPWRVELNDEVIIKMKGKKYEGVIIEFLSVHERNIEDNVYPIITVMKYITEKPKYLKLVKPKINDSCDINSIDEYIKDLDIDKIKSEEFSCIYHSLLTQKEITTTNIKKLINIFSKFQQKEHLIYLIYMNYYGSSGQNNCSSKTLQYIYDNVDKALALTFVDFLPKTNMHEEFDYYVLNSFSSDYSKDILRKCINRDYSVMVDYKYDMPSVDVIIENIEVLDYYYDIFDPNVEVGYSVTPLLYAMFKGEVEKATLLVKKGSKLDFYGEYKMNFYDTFDIKFEHLIDNLFNDILYLTDYSRNCDYLIMYENPNIYLTNFGQTLKSLYELGYKEIYFPKDDRLFREMRQYKVNSDLISEIELIVYQSRKTYS